MTCYFAVSLDKAQRVHRRGRQAIKLETLSMVDSIYKVLALRSFLRMEKGVDLVNFFEDDRDFEFRGNIKLFIRLIFALIKINIKALKRNMKRNIGIVIWLELGNEFNVLHFRSTGIGISKEVVAAIFDAYYNEDMDLPIRKIVLERMGVKITCKSEIDSYSHLKFYFPVL